MLMVAAILLIVAFQAYWLQKLYMEEAAGFKKQLTLYLGKLCTKYRPNA